MVVFVVKRYAVREAKKWRYAVRKTKIRRYAVRKGGGGCHPQLGLFFNCEAICIVFFSFDFIPFSSITPK